METLHPGLYVQETSGDNTIQGSSTSTAGFVGVTQKGAVGKPIFVTSWNDFVSKCGSFILNSTLAYAVKGFFDNGGKRAYISRVVHYNTGTPASAQATYDIKDANATPAITITVKALNDGVWGNDITLDVTAGSDADHFNLVVNYKGAVVENYDDATIDTIEDLVVNSKYITLIAVGTTVPAPIASAKLTGGDDGLTGLTDADYVGDASTGNGLYAFDSVKVNLVAVPAITTATVQNGVIAYVENRKDCLAILDAPKSSTPTSVKTYVTSTAKLASEYASFYYPWLVVSDPIGVGKSPLKVVPPSGHIMGVMAKMDNKGVWIAPSGVDAKINGVVDLEYAVTDVEQDILNPVCINAIRAFDGTGIVIWGTRTLSKGQYMYIPARRTMLFIEDSLLSNMRWTNFKNNDESLWDSIRFNVRGFLELLWGQKAFKGKSADEAFFVKCDDTINTPEVVDAGLTYVDIGVAMSKPNEFTVFRMSLMR